MLNTTETAAVKGRNSTAPHLLQSPHSSTSILKTHDEKLETHCAVFHSAALQQQHTSIR